MAPPLFASRQFGRALSLGAAALLGTVESRLRMVRPRGSKQCHTQARRATPVTRRATPVSRQQVAERTWDVVSGWLSEIGTRLVDQGLDDSVIEETR
jgi:hypothetical protein